MGDTTDCEKISFPSKDLQIQGQNLVKFLSDNLLIWLYVAGAQRRIRNVVLQNQRLLFTHSNSLDTIIMV